MHSLSAKTHGNSNDYRQLKSIATAIRNSKSSDNVRQWKSTTNDEVQRSTLNMHRQSQVSLLTGYPWPRCHIQDGGQYRQLNNNKIIYPKIKDRKTIAAIGQVRVDLTYALV